MVGLAEGFRDDQDVREDNRCIEGEALERLQGDLGGKFRGFNHFGKRVFLLQSAVFRQIAPGLTHHPDRGAVRGFASDGCEKAFTRGHAGGLTDFC